MVYAIALLAVTATGASPADAIEGTLSGIVVNASHDSLPAGGIEIVLRAQVDGNFVPVAQTMADAQGRFRFENLLIGGDSLYLPGANSDGVHYPGPRVQLTQQRPEVAVKLEIYDAVSEPDPLEILRYEIVIRPEPGALHVTESMIVENPSTMSYVGRAAHEGGEPVTLRLAIPSDFDRTTFNKEFFGRRFSWIKEKLVTGVPWPPGKRELKFSYVLANDLPGANSDGVHYPGPRVQLTQQRPEVAVKLEVYDAVSGPNPLEILRYEIVIRPEPGALHVTESMIVENPSTMSYVGLAAHEGGKPVTLRLAIPSDFDRTTFNKEFFGRRFSLIKEKLITCIPWPPGKRELKFSYVLANDSSHRIWRRPLDLPCRSIQLIVETDNPEEVSCSLGPAHATEDGRVIFQSTETVLPSGQVIQLELGLLPVRWMSSGRWIALLALVMAISASSLVTLRRRSL